MKSTANDRHELPVGHCLNWRIAALNCLHSLSYNLSDDLQVAFLFLLDQFIGDDAQNTAAAASNP
jgi:hypothetical protein